MGARYVCEVGVLSGDNLKNIASNTDALVFGIDMWEDDGECGTNDNKYDMQRCMNRAFRLLKRMSNVVLMRQSSTFGARCFPDGFFDFVYIDANHTYSHTKADIHAWWPKVRVGGVLAGHDYLDYEINGVTFGVRQAVDEIFGSDEIHVTEEEFPSWFVTKLTPVLPRKG
jgi:hypothetical protein